MYDDNIYNAGAVMYSAADKISQSSHLDEAKAEEKQEITREEYDSGLEVYVPKKPCPGMLLYTEETTASVKALNNEQLGSLIRALFCSFVNDGSLDDESTDAIEKDNMVKMLYTILQPKVMRAKNDYKETAYCQTAS